MLVAGVAKIQRLVASHYAQKMAGGFRITPAQVNDMHNSWKSTIPLWNISGNIHVQRRMQLLQGLVTTEPGCLYSFLFLVSIAEFAPFQAKQKESM